MIHDSYGPVPTVRHACDSAEKERAEQLCFLHDNLPFLNWEYWELSVKDGKSEEDSGTAIEFKLKHIPLYCSVMFT